LIKRNPKFLSTDRFLKERARKRALPKPVRPGPNEAMRVEAMPAGPLFKWTLVKVHLNREAEVREQLNKPRPIRIEKVIKEKTQSRGLRFENANRPRKMKLIHQHTVPMRPLQHQRREAK
jgi:hypothetical protein